jgi:hypothetical protein
MQAHMFMNNKSYWSKIQILQKVKHAQNPYLLQCRYNDMINEIDQKVLCTTIGCSQIKIMHFMTPESILS